MPYPYSPQAQSEYQRLFNTCVINPEKYAAIDSYINKMVQAKQHYENVSATTNVPWHVIAIIYCMEGSLSFNAHLHNGDPLTARTIQIPPGRPKTCTPPSTWDVSAKDALSYKGLDTSTDWSMPFLLYRLEGFNGYGYHKFNINSTYLWSYSNHYTKSKFIKDGEFSAGTVSKQCGTAVLLRRMLEKQIVTADAPITDRTTLIENLGADVNYSPSRYVPKEKN